MTSSRVNLRVPPRVVEDARAAQYANRETLAARDDARRVQRRVQQEVDAIRRAQPDLNRRLGGQLEFQRPPLQRLWRRKGGRVRPVDVGVGFLSLASQTNGELLTTTKLAIGSGNGLNWKYITEISPLLGNEQPGPFALLPVENRLLFVHFFTLYNPSLLAYSLTRVKVYEVTYDQVRDVAASTGLQQAIASTINFDLTNINPALPAVPRVWSSVGGNLFISTVQVATSAIYYYLQNPLLDTDVYRIHELEAEAEQRLGESIPVLGVNFAADPQPSGLPMNFDLSKFDSDIGAISGYSAGSTSSPTTPISLRRVYRHNVGGQGRQFPLIMANQFNYMAVTYDYHGGTYCRDRLAELGITL
jgi:hypothetical protein